MTSGTEELVEKITTILSQYDQGDTEVLERKLAKKKLKKAKKVSRKASSTEESSSTDVDINPELKQKVRKILENEPICKSVLGDNKKRKFNKYADLPAKPSSIFKDKTHKVIR